ncbi:WSC domain-containing protein [Leptodontidium sp. 2 PMI_412]|nr:WSC domain-containing protein [Leptodontidium sp. MPI-SDFR-AT-0119]KAH9207021.1 WSC domain-containing protein [Leptodontidium sp. 2 PMI_412]
MADQTPNHRIRQQQVEVGSINARDGGFQANVFNDRSHHFNYFNYTRHRSLTDSRAEDLDGDDKDGGKFKSKSRLIAGVCSASTLFVIIIIVISILASQGVFSKQGNQDPASPATSNANRTQNTNSTTIPASTSSATSNANRTQNINSTTITASTGEKWGSVGCYKDAIWPQQSGPGQRTLGEKGIHREMMTNEMCSENCRSYNYMGTENGNQCYCGNHINAQASLAGEASCSIPCGGEGAQKCGAIWKINIFQRIE